MPVAQTSLHKDTPSVETHAGGIVTHTLKPGLNHSLDIARTQQKKGALVTHLIHPHVQPTISRTEREHFW